MRIKKKKDRIQFGVVVVLETGVLLILNDRVIGLAAPPPPAPLMQSLGLKSSVCLAVMTTRLSYIYMVSSP